MCIYVLLYIYKYLLYYIYIWEDLGGWLCWAHIVSIINPSVPNMTPGRITNGPAQGTKTKRNIVLKQFAGWWLGHPSEKY